MAKLTNSDKTAIAITSTLLLIVLYGIFTVLCRIHENEQTERLYKGTVNNKYITSAGYKVSAKPYIVFYNDSLKRNITVRVSHNTYNSTKVGDWVGFYLTNNDLIQ